MPVIPSLEPSDNQTGAVTVGAAGRARRQPRRMIPACPRAWLVLATVLYARPLPALEALHLEFDTLTRGELRASMVAIDAGWRGGEDLTLAVTAAEVSVAGRFTLGPLAIRCGQAHYRDGVIDCAGGTLELRGGAGPAARARVRFRWDTGSGAWMARIEELELDLPAWSGALPLLHASLADAAIRAGRLTLGGDLHGRGGSLDGLHLTGRLAGLFLEGESATEDLSSNLTLALDRDGGGWSVTGGVELDAGALYLVPRLAVLAPGTGFYIEAGARPVRLELEGRWSPEDGLLDLGRLQLLHPGILDLKAAARLRPGADPATLGLEARVEIEDLEQTFPVYLQPLLMQSRFGDLETTGAVTLELAWQGDALQRLSMKLDGVYVDDARGRFGIFGLNGSLGISQEPEPLHSTLDWEGMSIYRLDIGAGNIVFRSTGNDVEVLEWGNVAVLDGLFRIENFHLRNLGTPDFELMIDGSLTGLTMNAFSHAMDWPLMPGSLAGTFTGLRYHHNRLELNGDIQVQVFDGDVLVRGLTVENLFSQYSVLAADVAVERLDLEQLTSTFTFGKIAGSLSGSMRGVVLEDWQPVRFDARFETVDDERPHRISRRALDNLNEIGGGLGGTMSQGFLRIFPEYSYGQMGITCRLQNNICELGGIRAAEGGSYLLTRGGLLPPWVEVRAMGRSIRWKELIDGLRQIAEREAVIE